ncbi:DUF2855 family protein [Alteromonas facilis]|uniref:DUF2855 family protein n=1 Tax=Alteromonas facilis TaxID=2048004 RepID=UPI000C28AFB9|nr:DUF2855 family protein [Alteromonas facilis]
MQYSRSEIEVQKDALMNLRQIDSSFHNDPADNAVVLKTEEFGFSSNNITYALLGDRFGYWGFFPASAGYGITPVWGFATVIESNTPELEVGEQVYGYLPMATHLVVHADKITDHSFMDVNPKRQSISPVYDQYIRCKTDPSYSDALKTWILTFRPLFTTSFVLAYALKERKCDEQATIWMTSASSKTAYGTAQILREVMPNARLMGITSAKQVDFVEQTGCYDSVFTYDQLDENTIGNSDWLLDFAGDQSRLVGWRASHENAKERTLLIGATDVGAQEIARTSTVGHVFFAPDEVRNFTKSWGAKTFQERYVQHWRGFIEHFQSILQEQSHTGVQAIVKEFQAFLNGEVDPRTMHVMRFNQD